MPSDVPQLMLKSGGVLAGSKTPEAGDFWLSSRTEPRLLNLAANLTLARNDTRAGTTTVLEP